MSLAGYFLLSLVSQYVAGTHNEMQCHAMLNDLNRFVNGLEHCSDHIALSDIAWFYTHFLVVFVLRGIMSSGVIYL